MSNRIDLTQFEGITKGPWRRTRYFSSWRIYWFDKEMSDNWDSIRCIGEEYRYEDFCFDVGVVASCEADAQLMAAAPDLLAELKRCYKLLDDADYAMSRYGDEEEHQDIDNVADAYEAVCNALAGQDR